MFFRAAAVVCSSKYTRAQYGNTGPHIGITAYSTRPTKKTWMTSAVDKKQLTCPIGFLPTLHFGGPTSKLLLPLSLPPSLSLSLYSSKKKRKTLAESSRRTINSQWPRPHRTVPSSSKNEQPRGGGGVKGTKKHSALVRSPLCYSSKKRSTSSSASVHADPCFA